MKFVKQYSHYTKMPFVISFRPQKSARSNKDNDFKISWATYYSRTILDSEKQTKWNLWD